MSQAQDLEAVNRYIAEAPLKTRAAEAAHDEWIKWYDGLSWLEKNFDSETWDRARNLKNKFNAANATNASEREMAARVAKSGLTTEEIAGGTRRTLSSGEYDVPLISTSTRMAIGGVVALAGLGYLATKAAGLYLKPYLPKALTG